MIENEKMEAGSEISAIPIPFLSNQPTNVHNYCLKPIILWKLIFGADFNGQSNLIINYSFSTVNSLTKGSLPANIIANLIIFLGFMLFSINSV